MPNRVYPDRLANAMTALGSNGTDLYALRVDVQSDGDWSLRVSTIADRAPSWASTYYSDTVAAHTATERWSYTVPSGKRAVIQAFHFLTGIPSSGTSAAVYVTLNTYRLCQLTVLSTTVQPANILNVSMCVYLKAGDVVKGYTLHSSTANLTLTCNAFIMEYDA